MFFPLLLMLGMFAMTGNMVPPPARRRKTLSVNMGSTPPPSQPTEKEKQYVMQTMTLTDPVEIERRAERIAVRYPKTAQAMLERAAELDQVGKLFPVPAKFAEVAPIRWTKFIHSVATNENDAVTKSNHLGAFGLAYPRLVALKLATNQRKVDQEGKKVWTADLTPPLTVEKLLTTPMIQYRVFVKSLLDYLPAVKDQFGGFIGKTAEGKKITLSGLLAIAHRAGIDGLKGWLTKPADRAKYPHTTATFVKSTEIF